ncbi:CsbD family protein [Formicincola oecophyllae]|nr:CsbD family protein [Formicincola oecophyllae]
MTDTVAAAKGMGKEVAGAAKKELGKMTGDHTLAAKGQFEEFAGHAQRDFADLYDPDETRMEATTTFIQERPFVSLGIAAFIGFIIGRLLLRRRG